MESMRGIGNVFKTGVLLVVLTAFLVLIGMAIGGPRGAVAFFGVSLLLNFSTYFWSDRIVLSMSGARPVGEADDPELFAAVRRLAEKANLPMPRLYEIDSDQPNAFATGRNPSHAAVAVTTGLRRLLGPRELEGVLAHELSHVRHRDILIATIAASIAGAISYLSHVGLWFGGSRDGDRSPLGGLLFIAVLILAPIAALLIQLAISRSREYAADAAGAELAGDAEGLATALQSLERRARAVPMDVVPATAHLYIVNPLTAKGFASLFSTHPPTEERVARLRAMAAGQRAEESS